MGRPRQYGSDAERQRAFRARLETEWARVDRRGLERLHAQLLQLQAAVGSAAAAGDESARACCAASVETVLDRVIRQFETRGKVKQSAEKPSP